MLTKESQNNFFVCFTSVVNPLKIDAYEVLEKMDLPLYEFENDCLLPPSKIPLVGKEKIVAFYKKSAQ